MDLKDRACAGPPVLAENLLRSGGFCRVVLCGGYRGAVLCSRGRGAFLRKGYRAGGETLRVSCRNARKTQHQHKRNGPRTLEDHKMSVYHTQNCFVVANREHGRFRWPTPGKKGLSSLMSKAWSLRKARTRGMPRFRTRSCVRILAGMNGQKALRRALQTQQGSPPTCLSASAFWRLPV